MASLPLLRPCRPGANLRQTAHPNTISPYPTHPLLFSPSPHQHRKPHSALFLARAKAKSEDGINPKESKEKVDVVEEVEEEVEEDLPWIQEKAMDLVEFTGTVTQAIPGPRVGQSSLPWILAVPLTYVGLSFVIAIVKTVRKFSSPKAKRRKLVNKNAMLCKSIDELFQTGRDSVQQSSLKSLMQKTGFEMEEVLRKYIRYALNEKPFHPEMVLDLIHLRKASMLDDAQVAEVLNEVSRRIVREKGPVVMDISGFTEKGFKRKLAVQALFGKIFYLSELPEFCSRDSSLIVKEIFGVTDDDADELRIHTLSEAGDVDSLQKLVESSDAELSDSLDSENQNDSAESKKAE
ncbi:hypothetical protein CKAN_01349600 [Cinnamomum micranthum f. kanehirae]|uniref:Armadillo-like repeats domain-containing protein n=1 Tax=Cinnamomum micranthum f. kanehirae TaxID=337451 RepID=A0A443P1S2_9MAGN|nr:hypothetical protein CKAN_01349600 [Cinnamomum micranthum f. kanehirae]